jgi:hypothetical protein
MDFPPLNDILDGIPAHRLDEKSDSTSAHTRTRVRIARSIGNWRTVAQFIPNIARDIDGIDNDNRGLEQKKIALLEKWVQRNGHLANYRQLAKCLYEAEDMNALDALRKELDGGAPQALYTTPTSSPPPAETLHAPRRLPQPTLVELTNLIKTKNPSGLGLQLGLEQSEVETIQVNHPTDHARQLYGVFSEYLRQTEVSSWIQVVEALRAIGERKCAKAVMDKFGIYASTPNAPTPTWTVPQEGTPTPTVPQEGTPTPTVPQEGTPTPTVPQEGTPTPTVPQERNSDSNCTSRGNSDSNCTSRRNSDSNCTSRGNSNFDCT